MYYMYLLLKYLARAPFQYFHSVPWRRGLPRILSDLSAKELRHSNNKHSLSFVCENAACLCVGGAPNCVLLLLPLLWMYFFSFPCVRGGAVAPTPILYL